LSCSYDHRLWFLGFVCLQLIVVETAISQRQIARQLDFTLISDSLTTAYQCDRRSVIQAGKAFLTSPLHWQQSDFNRFIFLSAVGGGLLASDQYWQEHVQQRRSQVTNRLAEFVRPLGDGRFTVPVMGLGYIIGWWRHDLRMQCTSVTAIESFLFANAVTTCTKLLLHRYRPNASDSPYRWDGPKLDFGNAHLSMPSGHATSAFAVVSVVASVYKKPILVPILLYSLATLTAWSRVNDNAHWTSDVFIGASIGYFTGKFLVHQNFIVKKTPIIGYSFTANQLSFIINF